MGTTITHACGHTVEHEQNFSDYFAERLSRRPCADCFREQYRAEVAAARASSVGLPTITNGTERQNDWATKIRADLIAQRPALGKLARYESRCRDWIDWRDQPDAIVFRCSMAAFELGHLRTLVTAAALEVNDRICRRILRERGLDADQLESVIREALWGMFQSSKEPRAQLTVEIAADRERFVALAMTPREGVDNVALYNTSAALFDAIDLAVKDAEEWFAEQVGAAERKAAAEKAEAERKAREAERIAAEARAQKEALERRWAPFKQHLVRLEWDADGYWSRRLHNWLILAGLESFEEHGAQAVRVIASAPNKAAVKALDAQHPQRALRIALDAQALASIVGPHAARAMHVAAGLPKPVIKKPAAVAV